VLRSVISNSELKSDPANSSFTKIIATGGGTPCFHANMEWMNSHGITVWLNPPATEIAERLINEKDHRPLLKDLDESSLLEFISTKIKEREKFYGRAKLELKNTNIAVTAFINQLIHAQESD
jgi:shikimate kinase